MFEPWVGDDMVVAEAAGEPAVSGPVDVLPIPDSWSSFGQPHNNEAVRRMSGQNFCMFMMHLPLLGSSWCAQRTPGAVFVPLFRVSK